jgi:hypothetical protein
MTDDDATAFLSCSSGIVTWMPIGEFFWVKQIGHSWSVGGSVSTWATLLTGGSPTSDVIDGYYDFSWPCFFFLKNGEFSIMGKIFFTAS